MPQIDISSYTKKKKTISERNGSFNLLELLNKDINIGNKQLSDRKKEEFYFELSMLLLSRVDLKTAFELVLIEKRKTKAGQVLHQIREQVVKGDSFSEALRKEKGKFSDYEYYSIRIGEETGKLGDVLKELANYYKNKIAQRRKIVAALTYPFVVLCTSLGAVFFMLKFVVPMFADVFTRFGGELPWITAFILDMSDFLDRTFWWVILFLMGIGVFIYRSRSKLWYRKWSSTILLKLPVAGNIIRKIHLARFANTMALLVSTNTPLLQAIQLVGQMSDFYPIQQSLLQTEKMVLQGESLYNSLSKFDFYPEKIVQLIKIGEEVNRLDYFFSKIASQLTDEIDYKTSTISTVLEPLIIIFLGLVVGLILIAMYLPMFQMSNSF